MSPIKSKLGSSDHTIDTELSKAMMQALSEVSDETSQAISMELLILVKNLLRAGEIEDANFICYIVEKSVTVHHVETAAEWDNVRKACAKLSESLSDFSLILDKSDIKEAKKTVSDFFDKHRIIDAIESFKISELFIHICWNFYLSMDQLGRLIESMERVNRASKILFITAYRSFLDEISFDKELITRFFVHKTIIESIQLDMDVISDIMINKNTSAKLNLPKTLSDPQAMQDMWIAVENGKP